MPRKFVAVVAAVLLSAACASGPPPEFPAPSEMYSLTAEYVIPTGTAFTQAGSHPFGGISGFAVVRDRQELLAISDDRENSRIFRLQWSGGPGSAGAFSVTPTGSILLQPAPGATAAIDPEGIALTEFGSILVSTEGLGDAEPRTPPSIFEFAPDGRFVGELPVPARFYPNDRGALTTGVRPNGGFESLTITPDFRAIYTANELPLVQDGDGTQVAQGSGGQVRILRYARSETGMGYTPRQQFAYEISPADPLPFTPQFLVNGLVELLALRDGELLALERLFAQAPDPQQSINRCRVYHVSLAGATDVALVASLKSGGHTVARKTLVADLGTLPGLSPALQRLDNFEALAFIPAGPAGQRMLLLGSDNNFNPRQVTAFLLLHARR